MKSTIKVDPDLDLYVLFFIMLCIIKGCHTMFSCSSDDMYPGFGINRDLSNFGNITETCFASGIDTTVYLNFGFCYFKLTGSSTFYAKQQYCRDMRGIVVEPRNQEQIKYLYNNFGHNLWIGVRRSGSKFYFEHANQLFDHSWASGQPNNKDEGCAITTKHSGRAHDYPCTSKFNTVCQKESVTCEQYVNPDADYFIFEMGFCYSIFYTTVWKTWIEAEAACRKHNGFLMETSNNIDSKLLMERIYDKSNLAEWFHIGGYKKKFENFIRRPYSMDTEPVSSQYWHNYPEIYEEGFLSINPSSRILRITTQEEYKPYICQNIRKDPCGSIYSYYLGDCYALRLTFNDKLYSCKRNCSENYGMIPEPRTKLQWEGLKLAMKHNHVDTASIFVGIYRFNGTFYYKSDVDAGIYKPIYCLSCLGIYPLTYQTGDTFLTLTYSEDHDYWESHFVPVSSEKQCFCRYDCVKPDGRRCYANNFDYENRRCLECPDKYYGTFCSIECSYEVCDMKGKHHPKCAYGRFGRYCEKVCSSKCLDLSTCSSVTGTCLGCKGDYRGLKCTDTCGICTRCDKNGKCLEGCPPGKYGDLCDKPCPVNCANGNCDINTGSCNECYRGYFGFNCDRICQGLCDINGQTIAECPRGTYGAYCLQLCSSSCLNGECSRDYGTCNNCVDGFYGLYCDRECTTCNQCNRNGDCSFDCILGYYGQFCERICSTKCKGQNCDKDGYCRECEDGFYGNYCAETCSTAVCDQHGNSLTKCVVGLFGAHCDQICSRTCLNGTCSQLTGACDSCVPGYYGVTCDKQCSPCDTCLRNGGCIDGCPLGTYGIDCTDKCEGDCLNGACDMATGSCFECAVGKYKHDCSENCTYDGACHLLTGDNVTVCTDGTYGENCDETCPSECPDKICSNSLGNCLKCEKGKYGMKCEKECDNCLLGCDFSGICIAPDNEVDNVTGAVNFTCGIGFFGPRCRKKCSRKCYMGSCDKNGKCVECKEGFYGEDCSKQCSTGYCDMQGNGTNEDLAQKCGEGLYGLYCDKTCNQNCFSNCSRTIGACLQCKKGFFGRNCEFVCPNCEECDWQGVCVKGCSKGWYGKKCEQKCHKGCAYDECAVEDGKCVYCPSGRYGIFCEKECGNCDAKCDSTGLCMGNCTHGYFGDRCDRYCPSRCFLQDCKKDGKCKECNQGYYDDSCNSQCLYNACDFEGNKIAKCEEKTHGPNCEFNCSFRCLNRKCQQVTGHCIDCVSGFYGDTCEKTCSKCSVCDRKGDCVSECSPGTYGSKCTNLCEQGCLHGYCDNNDGTCFECSIGSYGTNCDKSCSNISEPCDKDTGNPITECEVGTYGQNCRKTCPKNCLKNKCSKIMGTCYGCSEELALFGVKCEQQCGNCVEGCDRTGKCNTAPPTVDAAGNKVASNEIGCEIGYYGSSCESKCSKACLREDCDASGGCKACPPKLYGLDCSSTCQTEYCDVDGKTIKECPVGTYGEHCDRECSLACLNQMCTPTGVCLTCIKGYYGFDCGNPCTGCDDCDAQGICISECRYGLFGPRCQFKCNKNCLAFNCEPTSGICLECPNGYFGSDCSTRCLNNAVRCNMQGYQKQSCDSGIFGKDCNQTCPSTCSGNRCSDLGSCNSCYEGFYGATCNEECGNCGSCNRGGTCMSTTRLDVVTNRTIVVPRCANGLTGANCDKECSTKCLASNCDDEGKCRECPDGLYGENCEERCAGVCDITGAPIEPVCKSGTFGPNCEYTCSPNCFGSDCMKMSGTCVNCPEDKFGQFCENKCFATSECDRSGKALTKCYPGSFGERCEKKCSSSCLYANCDSNGFCMECPKGLYGADCQSQCNSTVCDIKTGEPIQECPFGRYGDNCKRRCSKSCKGRNCSQIMGSCASCKTGYFGLRCELICPNCAECDNRGRCTSECFPGFAGKSCDKGCPENCFAQTCNLGGKCAECAEGFYGETCTEVCPNRKLCDNNGEPVEECSNKYFGVNCTERCSKSCSKGCSKVLGLCTQCKYGTYGRFCELKCKKCQSGCNRQGVCYPVPAQQKGAAIAASSLAMLLLVLAALGVIGGGVANKKMFFGEEGAKDKYGEYYYTRTKGNNWLPTFLPSMNLNLGNKFAKAFTFMKWSTKEEAYVEEVKEPEPEEDMKGAKTMGEIIVDLVMAPVNYLNFEQASKSETEKNSSAEEEQDGEGEEDQPTEQNE